MEFSGGACTLLRTDSTVQTESRKSKCRSPHNRGTDLKPIPFDSLTLAAVVKELQFLKGGRLQRAVQPQERTLVLGVYAHGKEHQVLFSGSAAFPRVHLTGRRPPSGGEQPELAAAFRRLLDGARLDSIRQRGFDRILELRFLSREGEYRFVCELTGKHANLILVQPDGRIAAAAHAVPRRQSVRPIFAGARYEPPPFPPRNPVFDAEGWEEFEEAEGASPFLKSLLQAQSGGGTDFDAMRPLLSSLRRCVEGGDFEPVSAGDWGAYPISVAALGYAETRIESLSEALDGHFRKREEESEREALRSRLLSPLRRVLLAREVAGQELQQAADAARNARRHQERAELILAYASTIGPGQSKLETMDYEGREVEIRLDPEKTPVENARRLFEKAKHAKARAGFVNEQLGRIREERIALLGAVRRIEDAPDLETLRDEEERARAKNWLRIQTPAAGRKEDKPYEGHRIRELAGPGGVRVLYGENATSNDYLTLRVAKPNDLWLHVRGAASAHVVIPSGNRPERVGREALEFAARVAVAHSASKHSGYVSVDYTLKKYVRKPRGAPAGTVTYTHEKTIAIEPAR